MENHRVAGEEHPDFIALNQLQVVAAGGNYRTNLGGRRDPNDALGIDFAPGYPFYNTLHSIIGTAGWFGLATLKYYPWRLDLGGKQPASLQAKPLDAIVGNDGGKAEAVDGCQDYPGLDVAAFDGSYFANK